MNISAQNMTGSFQIGIGMMLCTLLLLGCSKKEEQVAAPNSQVVARLDNDVITIQELDNEFRLANVPIDKRKDPSTIKQFLGEIVSRKYLARRALNEKLDREPTVLLDILRARDIVLANSVASRDVTTKTSAITQSDIGSYIAKNPQKFSNRQIFTIEQIAFPVGSNEQSVVNATKGLNTLEEVDQKLTSLGVSHNRSSGVLDSGDLPPDLFNLLQTKQAGNIFFVRSGSNGVFFHIKGQQSSPLEGDSAVAQARQLLRSELVKTEIGMAGVEAKLNAKYEGEYAKIMGDREPGKLPTAQ
jgi:EpsD family peptidyl-prolyl cis-trans isomerase